MKKCIFHIPNSLEGNYGSHVRPQKMMQAFKDIGYDVDVVMGYGKERKQSIKKIKKNIRAGMKYDFMYSESSTMPTLLTEKNHLPLYPLLDFSFFRFCKKNGIRIGLFYRDIHWKFPVYKEGVRGWKREFAILMYRYDLLCYSHLLDVFYLPNKKMLDYVDNKRLKERFSILPPALDKNSFCMQGESLKNGGEDIHIFYVGGIGSGYQFHILLEIINKLPNYRLTICCRERDWKMVCSDYEKLLNDRIEIVHKSGADLEYYFDRADICSVFLKNSLYMEFAMSIKLFEYMENGKPIIATKGTANGEFVEKHEIGWSIEYDKDKLEQLLLTISENPQLIDEKRRNIEKIVPYHTWQARASKVMTDLTN